MMQIIPILQYYLTQFCWQIMILFVLLIQVKNYSAIKNRCVRIRAVIHSESASAADAFLTLSIADTVELCVIKDCRFSNGGAMDETEKEAMMV